MTRPFVSLILSAAFLSSCSHSYKKNDLSFSDSEFKIETEAWLQNESNKSLIILPPTGGSTLIDRRLARYFASRGYDVYILDKWTGQGEKAYDLEIHQRLYSRAQKAIQLLAKKIQTPFIGILGTSVGALFSSVAITTIPEIDAAFFIVGGLSIPEVIVSSDQKAMSDLKKNRYKLFGFKSDAEYIQELSRVFPIDPTRQGNLHKTKNIGVVYTTEDSLVPTETQIKLIDFFQPKTIIKYSHSHFCSIVRFGLIDQDKAYDFFESSLQ